MFKLGVVLGSKESDAIEEVYIKISKTYTYIYYDLLRGLPMKNWR